MGNLRLWGSLCVLSAVMVIAAAAQDSRPPLAPHTIPDGTTFLIRLEDKLDTSRLQPGKHFKAKVAEDLVGPDGAMIPRGKKIKGHVSSVDNGFHARLLLSFDEIETEHGWVPLIATVTDVPGERGIKRPDEEGEIERKGANKRREVERAGIGAGVGAAGGAVAGGGRGAAIGAGVGAVAGAVSGLFTDRRLRLEKGTTLELRLDHPLQVPWH
jgi:YMGG-like Gly-zipper